MSWDRFQRAVLAELGHDAYRTVAGTPRAVPAPACSPGRPAPVAEEHEAALLTKLAQAARLSPQALQAEAGILEQLPRLRTDPAAKRALWPRLRALRRGRA